MQAFRLLTIGNHIKYAYGNRLLCNVPGNSITCNVSRGMAGHSKFANIKHTKAIMDARRMKSFLKFSRMMRVAIRDGGSADPRINSKLGKVVEIAQTNNMPMAKIENVLKSNQKTQENAKAMMLEYRGPGGVFLLAELLTESISRARQSIVASTKKLSVQEVKGSARHMFDEKGVIVTNCKEMMYEQAMDNAIEAGAEEVTEEDGTFVFTCAPHDLIKVKQALEGLDMAIESADVEFLPTNPVTISDDDMELLQKVLQRMEDLDDVMKVHVNL